MTEHRSEWINFEEEKKKSQERIKASLDIKVKGDSMSRLESIKDDLKLFNTTTEANIEWLLQRLEITQKALEHYADIELYKGIQEGELFADWFMRQNHVAVQALEKIKEP